MKKLLTISILALLLLAGTVRADSSLVERDYYGVIYDSTVRGGGMTISSTDSTSRAIVFGSLFEGLYWFNKLKKDGHVNVYLWKMQRMKVKEIPKKKEIVIENIWVIDEED